MKLRHLVPGLLTFGVALPALAAGADAPAIDDAISASSG